MQITVIRVAPYAPNQYPNKPEKIVPIKGKLSIKKYMKIK